MSIDSSNKNEVIRAVLNFLLIFFHDKVLQVQKSIKKHQKGPKSSKNHQKTSKSIKKTSKWKKVTFLR